MDENPIQFLATRIILTDDNLPIRILRTREEHLDAQLSRQEMMEIRIFGAALLLPAIDGIVARYGISDPTAVAGALTGPFIDPAVAARLADGIAQFFDAAHDRAAHIITPRLERVLREMARQSGALVIREPAGATSGGVRSLAPILGDLEGVLDERWRRYFFNVLCDELGINLRNRIAHGLIDEVAREDAALLVHIAYALSLLRYGPGASS